MRKHFELYPLIVLRQLISNLVESILCTVHLDLLINSFNYSVKGRYEVFASHSSVCFDRFQCHCEGSHRVEILDCGVYHAKLLNVYLICSNIHNISSNYRLKDLNISEEQDDIQKKVEEACRLERVGFAITMRKTSMINLNAPGEEREGSLCQRNSIKIARPY